jgi:RES domain-containing protein
MVPSSTVSFGDEWVNSTMSVGLLVPSVIIPAENNLLINPEHPDFESLLETVEKIDFPLDARLFNRLLDGIDEDQDEE